MKNIRGLLALFLVLLLFAQTGILGISAVTLDQNGQPTKYSDTYNSGTRHVVANTLNGTGASAYYTGNYQYDTLSKQSATNILDSLHALMTNTHTKRSSYDDCHYMADQTDCENENGTVSLIYTNYSATMDQWDGWNREHVWPKSLGGDNTSGGGADLHHIRPSDANVNSTRGNKLYGYANGGKEVYGNKPATGKLGGKYGTYFEPNDNVKGDVARICLYVYVRWGSEWGATSITKVFQSVDVLLEWCALDPVDTWELGRNEVVEAYQGNRNVFIDYPEYAWLIFGRSVPTDLVSPTSGNSGSTTPPEPSVTEPTVTEPTVTEPTVTEPTVPDAPFNGTGSIDFSKAANRVSWDGNQQTWKQDGITLVNDKAASTDAVANYTNPARFYANSKLTITAPGMTKIAFTCNSGSYATTLKNSIPDSNTYSVSVSKSVVTVNFKEAVDSFVVDKLSAQVRVNSLSVQGESSTPVDPPVTDPTTPPVTDPTVPGTPTVPTEPGGSGSSESKEPTGLLAFFIQIINAILAIFGLKLDM